MTLELTLQIVQTIAVVVGVVFGLIQLYQLRVQREAQGAAEMLRSLQTTLTARAALLMYELPDNLSTMEFKAKLGEDDFAAVSSLMATFESLGPLVARGHIPIDVYADYYRGATVVCWRKARSNIATGRHRATTRGCAKLAPLSPCRSSRRGSLERTLPAVGRLG